MSNLVPALAVAFTAFCVWLTVRLINRRERWAKWSLAVTLSVPVLYVASFGPACWMTSHLNTGKTFMPIAYRPMAAIIFRGPTSLSSALSQYSHWYAARRWGWSAMSVDDEIFDYTWDNDIIGGVL